MCRTARCRSSSSAIGCLRYDPGLVLLFHRAGMASTAGFDPRPRHRFAGSAPRRSCTPVSLHFPECLLSHRDCCGRRRHLLIGTMKSISSYGRPRYRGRRDRAPTSQIARGARQQTGPYHSGRQASACTPSARPGFGQGRSRACQPRPASSDLKRPWLLAA
jgi:hypothetical protein